MSQLAISASAAIIEAADTVLQSPSVWPQPATGLARRILVRGGAPLPSTMLHSLRQTSARLLRLTPEIAAFGYVLDFADSATVALWIEAIEHLRGREIYPADRQSFIFNPVEILGVAAGIALPSVPGEHQEWLANTILRGMTQGQFRTPLSRLAWLLTMMCSGHRLKRSVFPCSVRAAPPPSRSSSMPTGHAGRP